VATELHVWKGAVHAFYLVAPNGELAQRALSEYVDAIVNGTA
jgi:hypothetical protein